MATETRSIWSGLLGLALLVTACVVVQPSLAGDPPKRGRLAVILSENLGPARMVLVPSKPDQAIWRGTTEEKPELLPGTYDLIVYSLGKAVVGEWIEIRGGITATVRIDTLDNSIGCRRDLVVEYDRLEPRIVEWYNPFSPR